MFTQGIKGQQPMFRPFESCFLGRKEVPKWGKSSCPTKILDPGIPLGSIAGKAEVLHPPCLARSSEGNVWPDDLLHAAGTELPE